ncbi:MAG: hypothetical protein V4732_06500 [Pseudomonadota bacterium]
MSLPTVIKQLNANQLARHAFNVFLFSGRHVTGAKLIYRALELDSHNAVALRNLSDFMDAPGTETFSAVALEYALCESTGIVGEPRKILDDVLFLAKWSWSFSKHNSGNPHLGKEAFSDREAFTVDQVRYKQFLDQTIIHAGSLENAFRAAHLLCGILAGFFTHKLGGKVGIEESFHADRFIRAPIYQEWLESSTEELDALEEARQKNKG